MSDFTINVDSDGEYWAWQAEGEPELHGRSRRLIEVEDEARRRIIDSRTLLRHTGFTTEVVMANPYMADGGLPFAVICDIDGTLAIHNNRGPFDFAQVETDDLNRIVADHLDLYENEGLAVILLSGRQEEYRDHTVRWLEKQHVSYSHLFMRPAEDRRSDDIVKLELFDKHVRGRFNVTHVLDDRDRCVYLWRKLGLACWQVAPGDF